MHFVQVGDYFNRVRCKPAKTAWEVVFSVTWIDNSCLRSCAHMCHCQRCEQVEMRCPPSARQCVINRVSQLPAVDSDSLTRIKKVPVNSQETESRLNLQLELNSRRNARAFSFWIYLNRSQLFNDSFR